MISIIIPAYNSAATIRYAIASVAAQAFADYEVIVVDDASTDGTAAMAESELSVLQGSGFRVQVLKLPDNLGPAAARNRGIAEAKGEWIAFLDADDGWLPGKLELQMAYVQEHPDVVMVCGGTLALTDESDSRRLEDNGINSTRRLVLDDFVAGNPVATSTVLVKKDVLLAVGGFDEQFRGPEDYDLWMRIAAVHSIDLCPVPVARYRETPGSLSMDDRKFLPMVMGVMRKAFGTGGAFFGRNDLYSSAISNQYWNASWMAFRRGSRLVAIRYWLISYLKNLFAAKKAERQWFSLLARYVIGAAPTR